MTELLAIDPGGQGKGTTGIVRVEFYDDLPVSLIGSWAVPNGVDGFIDWFYQNEPETLSDVLVCEKFVDRQIRGADRMPLVIEGAVKALWHSRGVPIFWQPASGKNTAVPDTSLKKLGLYNFPSDHHHDQREAARHAVWYLKSQRHIPTLRAGW